MARSVYLARLIGPPLVIIALGMLIDQGGFMELSRNFMADPALIYVASAAGLFVGLAIVLAHNVWTPDWRVLITLLGWVSMLDSASWMLARRQITDVWRPLLDSTLWPQAGGAITLLLGAILVYFGYLRRRTEAD